MPAQKRGDILHWPAENGIACPVFRGASESPLQARLDPRQIIGMKMTEPGADLVARGPRRISEQTCRAAGPGKRAAAYIPIPNRIVRNPSKDFKVIRARCHNVMRVNSVLLPRTGFMIISFSGRPPGWIYGCCRHAVTAMAAS